MTLHWNRRVPNPSNPLCCTLQNGAHGVEYNYRDKKFFGFVNHGDVLKDASGGILFFAELEDAMAAVEEAAS